MESQWGEESMLIRQPNTENVQSAGTCQPPTREWMACETNQVKPFDSHGANNACHTDRDFDTTCQIMNDLSYV
jgi:hypothetical protein